MGIFWEFVVFFHCQKLFTNACGSFMCSVVFRFLVMLWVFKLALGFYYIVFGVHYYNGTSFVCLLYDD